ncbi:MAG: CvpA family protein, partial [Candidatus Limnocylindrales bacterium]
MDIFSAPVIDAGIFLGLFFFFIVGMMQGSIRRILGIISILFAFLIAANLRDPVGNLLKDNWTQFSPGYNQLLAFVLLFIVGAVASSILIQGFYKRTEIYAKHPIVDDLIGGALGLVQGALLLLVVVIILNSFTLPTAQSGDVTFLRNAQDAIHRSTIAGGVKDVLAPPFIHVLSFLLPSDLTTIF